MARDFKNSRVSRRDFLKQTPSKKKAGLLEAVPKFVQVGVVILLVILGFVAGSVLNKATPDKQLESAALETQDLAESESLEAVRQEVELAAEQELVAEEIDETQSASADKTPTQPEEDLAPVVDFTFYTDLSQEMLKVDVKPLPVKLKKPLWIQAASTLNEAAAIREQERLTSEGIEILISTGITKNGDKAYRLVTGPFTDKRDLNAVMNRLKIKGSDGFAIPDPFAQ